MDLISNSLYDVRAQYGHLILVCLGSDEQKCIELQHELSRAGYAYLFFPISEDTLSKRDYISDITRALDTCSCLVPIITDGLFAEDYQVYRNVFWFVAGYMHTKHSGAIVPFLCEGDGRALSYTPLKNANLATSETEIVRTLENKFSNSLMKSHYYDNYLLNFYAYKRILYRRVTFKCRIYEDAFRRIAQTMEYEWGSGSDAKLDRFLGANLMSAYKVLSFGCDNALEPQFEPYKDEIYPSENGLSSSIICNSSYSVLDDDDRAATGIHAEIDVEAVVPVHKLFGVYFKCYFSLRQSDYFWMLPMLFSRDIGKLDFAVPPTDDEIEDPAYWRSIYPENTHVDFRRARLYLSLGLERLNTEKSIILTPEVGVGKTADYIFPQ